MKLIVSLLCVFLICQLQESQSALSGFYVDNGEQTVIEQTVTERQKREVEMEFLDLLGLDGKPRIKRLTESLGSSAPKFLLDVYRTQDEHLGSRIRSEFNLSSSDLNSIDQSDIIMSFASHSRHLPSIRHERGKRLWFDVSEVTSNENLIRAELHLFQTANYSVPKESDPFVISVYLVLDSVSDNSLELVDKIETTADHEGWLLLNMTLPFSTWTLHPKSNNGIYLSLHHRDNPNHELLPEDVGLLTESHSTRAQDKLPFMAVFMKESPDIDLSYLARRSRRRVRRQITRRRRDDTTLRRNPLTESNRPSLVRSCQMRTLYVSFKDLGWKNWIIAPEGFEAYYCSGECNFPLSSCLNATNHAVVQTLIHSMFPTRAPKPSCAPTKLSPISVLYFLNEKNVVMKKHKNMAVRSCGCH